MLADSADKLHDDMIQILRENSIEIVDEVSDQIKRILTECNNDKNQFIARMIDSYFRPFEVSPSPTTQLPQDFAGIILYQYINNTDLDTTNVINMASNIIPKLKRGDAVDIVAVTDILRENGVSGLVFVKGTEEYMNSAKFSRMFKPLANWKETKGVFSRFWKEMNRWRPVEKESESDAKPVPHDDEQMLSEILRHDDDMKLRSNSEEKIESKMKMMSKKNIGTQQEYDEKATVVYDANPTECKQPISKCAQCQKVKDVLIKYQNAVSRTADNSDLSANSQQIIDNLFEDDMTATQLLDHFQHIIREHHINDDHSRFDSCFEFMVNTQPRISCDISKCKAARLYFSRRRGRIDDIDNGNVEIPSDNRTTILWQIHSFLVHSLETTMLTMRERMDIEEGIKMRDDGDEDEVSEDLKLKLVAEKMQQKSILMEKIVDNTDNSKFVTTGDFVENRVENENEEAKYPEQIRQPTIYQDDERILERFRNLTNCDAAIATIFLKKSDWNFQIAIDRFYEFSGDPTRIESFWEEKEDDIPEQDGVYTEGIRFWYWRRDESMPDTAVPVTRQQETLKDEILNSGHVGMITWNRFVAECTALLRAKFVRQMSANGIGEDIYEIRAGDPFALRFLLALKLYTDFDALNKMFCEHFRIRKLTPHSFESVRSLVVRNGRFWHLAKLLVECVQCFGRLLVRKKTRYYRGIGQQFTLKRFVARFHVPLSTSKSVCPNMLHFNS